jgi:hypothetical protein
MGVCGQKKEMIHVKFLSPNWYKTALYSISKRLCKEIARMDSDTFVVKINRRMMPNDAALFLSVSYT